MSIESASTLYLPDLRIKGFRSFEDIHIPMLGRVTLLAGKNGVGKTSVLEAIQAYAARGSARILSLILNKREEYLTSFDEEGEMERAPDPESLFYNWRVSTDSEIVIGPTNEMNVNKLIIGWHPYENEKPNRKRGSSRTDSEAINYSQLKSSFAGQERILPWIYSPELGIIARHNIYWHHDLRFVEDNNGGQLTQECRALGPTFISNSDAANYWGQAILNGDEQRVIEAVGLVLSKEIDLLTMIEAAPHRPYGQRVVVRLDGSDKAVPLKSLGDGASRLFGIAAAFASLKNGFLVIDEAENGIHYSVMHDYWRIIFKMAKENNVQVFGTTHSYDCVEGFEKAASESKDNYGVLVRLERSKINDDIIRSVEYPEESLRVVVEQGSEVR